MNIPHIGFQSLPFLSTGIYFCGLAWCKMAAAAMPPLRGDRPWRLAWALAGSRMWFFGAVVIGAGAAVQTAALHGLSLFQAQPMLLAGLSILLVLAVPVLRERLTPREWACVALLAAATALFVHAAPTGQDAPLLTRTAPPAPVVVAVALPSLLVPCLGLLTGDLRRGGMHARPLTGVALAVNVGLLTTGSLLLGEPWPGDRRPAFLALALSVLAIAAIPHHERTASHSRFLRVPTTR
ncbi:hypothetical protein AB0C21_17325 [Spirillospora sp. NPDC049024]